MSRSNMIKSMTPLRLVETLEEMRVNRVIILDLARVGSEQGTNIGVVKEILKNTGVEIITGGGIRGIEDLEQAKSLGVSAVLIATALHSGKLTAVELESKGFMK